MGVSEVKPFSSWSWLSYNMKAVSTKSSSALGLRVCTADEHRVSSRRTSLSYNLIQQTIIHIFGISIEKSSRTGARFSGNTSVGVQGTNRKNTCRNTHFYMYFVVSVLLHVPKQQSLLKIQPANAVGWLAGCLQISLVVNNVLEFV